MSRGYVPIALALLLSGIAGCHLVLPAVRDHGGPQDRIRSPRPSHRA